MIVFGPKEHREAGARRIFRASADQTAPPSVRPDALARLLLAADEAERSQYELNSAKARYQKAPSQENLQTLLGVAARALEKECAFDEIWDEVSSTWFGESTPIV